jgi:hypothetical protein
VNFFKSKMWPFGDIVLLKLYCVVVGIIIGAHIAAFVKSYLWFFVLVAIVLVVRLFYFYFFKND